MSKYIYPIIILALLVIIFQLRYCHPCPEPTTILRTDTITINHYDTIREYRPKYIDRVLPIEKWYTDSIYVVEPVDTTTILRDYFTTYYYSDTARIPAGTVIIQDSVTRNKIAARRVFTDLQTTIIRESVMAKLKANVFAGLMVIGNKENGGVVGTVSLKTARHGIVKIGAVYTDRWWWGGGYDFLIK